MEKEKVLSEIDIDMADFHGIDTDNPYKTPQSDDNPFDIREFIEIGFWGYAASVIVIVWYAFLGYKFSIIMLESENIGGLIIFILSVVVLISVTHLMSLFKLEAARKFVVFHSYLLLPGIPIGTAIGVILLKTFKGKRYRKT